MTWWLWLLAGLFVGAPFGILLAGLAASAARGGLLELDTPAARGALSDRDNWFRETT